MDSAEGAQAALAATDKGTLPEYTTAKPDVPKKPVEESKPQASSSALEKDAPLKQVEGVEGGETKAVALSTKDMEQSAKRLRNRLETIRSLKNDKTALTEVEELVFQLGPAAITRLENGDILTERDYALLCLEINDELFQKSLAAAKKVQSSPSILENVPFLRKFAKPKTELEDTNLSLKSDYLEKILFYDYSEEALTLELTSLNTLRLNIEKALYGGRFSNPLFDQNTFGIGGFLQEFSKGTTNRLHNEVVNQLEKIAKQKGIELSQLFTRSQIEQSRAIFDAFQAAAAQTFYEQGLDILRNKSITSDSSAIEAQAKKLEDPPKLEEIKPFEETFDKVSTEFVSLETRHTALATELAEAEKGFPELKNTSRSSSLLLVEREADLAQGIRGLEDRLRPLNATLGSPPVIPHGLTPEQQAEIVTTHNNTVSQQSAERMLLLEQLKAKEDYLEEMKKSKILAEVAVKSAEEKIKELKSALKKTEREMLSKKTEKDKAERDLEDKKQEIAEGGSPERKEKAKTLRKWNEVSNGQNDILSAYYYEDADGAFSCSSLSRIAETDDGQVEGTEQLRELIFQHINKSDFDPEMARKMLSDETIARAIIWKYKVDTSRPGNLRDAYRLVEAERQALSLIPKRNAAQRKAQEKIVIEAGKQLAKEVLPYLKRSQLGTGRILQFLISEGVRSAEKGNPYLELPKRYNEYENPIRR
jgi:protein-tyrosine-phosphatase